MADHVAVGPGQSMVAQTQAAQSTSLPHSTDPTFIHSTHLLYCYSADTQIHLQ